MVITSQVTYSEQAKEKRLDYILRVRGSLRSVLSTGVKIADLGFLNRIMVAVRKTDFGVQGWK